jgi:alanyl-tRNA synthetase
MNTKEIRALFTGFFAERGHRNLPSSSLIPPPDERTLLFSNAGMNQIKPYFMGMAEPPSRRMTTIQKCFRTSDIEEVGDASHCTFFEMLGNFSVGDYFKAEVIAWAWALLTTSEPKGMGLAPSRIWTTVFLDDDEAYDLWRSVGIPPERIVRFNESENYWFMIKGGAGPCGPNSEIYYDFGPEHGCGQPDCAPPLHDCGRFIELWNLVFMSLYQEEDGVTRRPLPMKNVDTGGGLERWPMAYMFERMLDWRGRPKEWDRPPTIYDSDLFRPILERIGELTGVDYDSATPEQQRSLRVVAEHTRAATFLISDGVTPANDGRGYVLRRLIRRSTSFGQRLNPNVEAQERDLLLASTAETVIELMASEHETLTQQKGFVLQTLRSEEARFYETLMQGRSQLAELKERHPDHMVAGSEVFQLWDTYGFPPELTLELLSEDDFAVADPDAFEALMQEQRDRSRAATRFEGDSERIQTYAELGLHPTEFVGYETTRAFATVASIVMDGSVAVGEIDGRSLKGHRVEVTLDQTPFYPEGGGQVGDRGEIIWPGGRFLIEDTQSVGEGGVIAHVGQLESGSLSIGDPIEARVDELLRADTMRNHTGTHILHAALRNLLGPHVRQAGSLVTPDRLRFDFTHLEALTPEQIRDVEALANRVIRDNLSVHVEHKSYEEALADGALAFFGDKYAEVVRVVGVCDLELKDCFSHELCGGTHVHASGEVGAIIITQETSIGAGLRRLEAVTGRAAAERVRAHEDSLGRLGASLQIPVAGIEARVAALREDNDRLRKQIQTLERRIARSVAESTSGAVMGPAEKKAGDVSYVAQIIDAPSSDFLRSVGDSFKAKLKSGVVLLGANLDAKPVYIAMVTDDLVSRCGAGDVVRAAAQAAGGNGGGRPQMAQGAGTDGSKLQAGIDAGERVIVGKLSG